jgi:hypothetical protein
MLTGCAMIAFIGTLSPPPMIKPKCTIPDNSRVLVMVEMQHSKHSSQITHLITEDIRREFRLHKIADTVRTSRLATLKRKEGVQFSRMGLSTIGERTGANMVLYVRAKEFGLGDSGYGQTYQVKLDIDKIRLVDVKKKRRVWPEEGFDGHSFLVKMKMKNHDGSTQFEHKQTQSIAREAADRIAKLFYEYQAKEKLERTEFEN